MNWFSQQAVWQTLVVFIYFLSHLDKYNNTDLRTTGPIVYLFISKSSSTQKMILFFCIFQCKYRDGPHSLEWRGLKTFN